MLANTELWQALGKTGLSKDEIKELFEGADSDGDSSINLEEFINLMESTGMYN